MLDAGAYSWVSDIRNRVSVAKVLSRNEGEFMRILELMEVEVSENSAHAPREDWIFSLADQRSKKVSGERLGMTFGKIALTERFERIGSYHPDVASSRAILSMATDAVELNDIAELGSLAKTVETNARYSIGSSADYGRRIEALQRRMDREEEPRAASKCAERIEELESAMEYATERGPVSYTHLNLGRGVELACRQNEDLELAALFTRRDPASVQPLTAGVPVYAADDLAAHTGDVDVLVLCGGSARDLPEQTPACASLFNVVDSFDTHANIPAHFADVDVEAKAGGKVALISGGWDPGMFSLARLYATSILPEGHDYTFWLSLIHI